MFDPVRPSQPSFLRDFLQSDASDRRMMIVGFHINETLDNLASMGTCGTLEVEDTIILRHLHYNTTTKHYWYEFEVTSSVELAANPSSTNPDIFSSVERRSPASLAQQVLLHHAFTHYHYNIPHAKRFERIRDARYIMDWVLNP